MFNQQLGWIRELCNSTENKVVEIIVLQKLVTEIHFKN